MVCNTLKKLTRTTDPVRINGFFQLLHHGRRLKFNGLDNREDRKTYLAGMICMFIENLERLQLADMFIKEIHKQRMAVKVRHQYVSSRYKMADEVPPVTTR